MIEITKKGTPSPAEYTNNKSIPLYNVSADPASNRMEDKASPTHGVHPEPKASPKRNELAYSWPLLVLPMIETNAYP